MDTEESVRIRVETVSEEDIRRQCVGLYAALGLDLPASGKAYPEAGSFSYLDEYLNHALKLSVYSGDLPQTKYDIRHKTSSFMRTLQHCPDKVSAFFHHNQISYILVQ